MDWTIKLIVVCTLTHLVSSQDANSEASNKSVEHIARMPSHTVLMYFLEMEITECSYECAKHLRCMTINYNFKQRICELVDSTFDKYEADFETKDWINIGVPKINGNFSEWRIASGCTVTCGNGTRRLVRECDNPRPTLGGLDCEGEREKVEDCNLKECPIDGNWNEWSSFSVMNDTCIGYKRSRNRTCGNPPPSLGGLKCLKFNGERDMVENETLFIKPKQKCVHGHFSEWKIESECSVTCGNGTQRLVRECDNPRPTLGGRDCEGEREKVEDCAMKECPSGLKCLKFNGEIDMVENETLFIKPKQNCVNGNFSEWKIESGCSVTCGNGTQRLVRECDNPRPALGGRDCEGEREKVEDCAMKECPICYEGKDDKPGTIDITKSGKIKSLRLTHVSGYLDCAPTGTTDTRSFWGCGPYQHLQTVITRMDKTIIFPEDVDDSGQDEVASPESHKDPELRFKANRRDINVEEGEHLQVWYAEDLKNHYDNDNEGRHCIYVDVEYK